ncbi:MAG: hypothetical protein ACLT0Y_09185 [Christensenellales bacterium]
MNTNEKDINVKSFAKYTHTEIAFEGRNFRVPVGSTGRPFSLPDILYFPERVQIIGNRGGLS